MSRTKPPFRADQVGSLLRPQELKDARAKHEAGDIGDAELKEVEDRLIADVIKKQEGVGLQCATDGEFRRAWWHFDFLEGIDGVEGYEADQGIQFSGVQTKSRGIKVTGKLDFTDHPFLDHFRFTKSKCSVMAKQTIPSPSVLHYRGGRKGVDEKVYPDMDEFFHDMGKAYNKAVKAFYDAGCRYLQLDDTVWAYLCSEAELQKVRDRGEDPEPLAGLYARTINEALEGKPDDMTVTMHVCRGNFRSTWISEGGYEPVAEIMFQDVNLDGYFLEYDSDRAGDFKPLRFVPKGNKMVVLGLVTSKTGDLENTDDIKKRLDEASQFMDMDQICLSPQCGFASTEEGNILTEDQQWAKLRMIVDLSKEVWG